MIEKTNILDKSQNNNQAGQVIIICEDNEEDVALIHLNEQYGLSIVDLKLYHPNLLEYDRFIKNYQKIHCDFDVGKPKKKLEKK